MFLNPTHAPYVSISFTIACVTAIGLVTGRAFLAKVDGGTVSGSVRDSSGRANSGAHVPPQKSRRVSLIRLTPRLWLLLFLWLFGGVLPHACVAGQSTPQHAGSQVKVDPQPIRYPVVDATDNRFLRLSTADEISQTKVDHIVQDNEGFLWFGTRWGLYRYDGYAFKVFVRDAGNPKSLDGVVVRALFKDRDGVLWVACDQSLNKFEPTTETFTRYPIPLVTHISQDTAGVLWLTSNRGLYGLDPSSGRIWHYSHDPNDPSSLGSDDPAYCGEDKRGTFWVASSGRLDEFDRKAGKVTRHIVIPDAPTGFQFYEDRSGVFWIFHASPNALATFDRKTGKLTRYVFPTREPTMMKVSAMLEDRNDTLWIATHGLGLLKLDREHGRFVRYSNLPEDPESLPQNKVDALLADREGNIWVALGRMAPALLATKPPPFKKLPKVPGSTIEPFVGALYEDRQGVLWVGTPEALLRLDRNTGRITEYRTGGPGVGTDVVSICEDRSGNLWVGTYSHGIHRFDRRTGKFKTYRHNPADPHSLSNDIVMRLLVDHNGTLWAGTAEGLDRFDARTERFTTYPLEPNSNLLVLELIEDRGGKIWIGTESSGLRLFDPAKGQSSAYRHTGNLPGTLSDDRVNSVHFDRSGTMWVGTQNGLDTLNPQTGRFSAFTQKDGLSGNAVGCILEDKYGNLWMSTNNGVSRFNPQSKTFTNFSTAEGLPGPNLTGWGACFQSPSGEMFFGGFNGGTSFFPDKAVDSSNAPRIVLTDFRLFGNRVQIGGDSPLRESISRTRNLVLPHQQNVFSITFAALSYASPATNRYRYMLEGLERDWNEVGSDWRQAIYTTLPSGTYTFRVQGANRGGPWSEPGVALRIEILPPWWEMWWFRVIGVIAAVCMPWALYQLRIQQLVREYKMRLDERVNERTRIARELHDSLLQGFQGLMFRLQAVRDLLPGQASEAMHALDIALERGDKAIAEGRDTVLDLREPILGDSDIAQALTTLGEGLVLQSGNGALPCVRVLLEGKQRELNPMVRDEIYRIAREALRNAFVHARAQKIEVEITYSDSEFLLHVRDDGGGLAPEVANQGARAGHWGLPGMRERAKSFGGKVEVWSEHGAGTEIKLRIPGAIAYGKSEPLHRFWLWRKKIGESDGRQS
jgi:ligand-binding sensor domain-containing protein/signal transduction histidine kinase